MFCMNCGQQLPDGAKFCLNCGTPQGAISPIGTTQAETINLDGMHTFVPAMCPNCNAHMKVDTSSKVARCDNCGTECLVQDAIKALTVRGNVQVESATINVNGTNTDSLLQRVEIMLGDGDFNGAMSKCDKILDSDPTNGRVYFYMLMSDLQCRNKSELTCQKKPFDGNDYYIKAFQYGDENLKSELLGYINEINVRNEAITKNPKVGDEIFFGTNNGQKIWWKVLRIQDRMALIISAEDICLRPYHETWDNKTWSDCSLRNWLNNGFINGYFSQAEQSRILFCNLSNDKNPKYGTLGGPPTTDKVFLLSIHEANILFDNDQDRASASTWWLRSPGMEPGYAACVEKYGYISESGTAAYMSGVFADGPCGGVRPALWIKLDY